VSPLSRDPVKRGAQLANLRGAAPGEQRARQHGGYAQVSAPLQAQREREIYEALSADAPLRDAADELPRHDAAIVTLLAQCMCRLETVAAHLRDHGMFIERGKRKGMIRPAVELEAQYRREAARYLAELGMTPKARTALGVDLVRSIDLASDMADTDHARRDARMRELGLVADQGPDDE
jgi:Phage terminase, small subunit